MKANVNVIYVGLVLSLILFIAYICLKIDKQCFTKAEIEVKSLTLEFSQS